jgi:2-aminoadipate transaminase
MPHFSKSALSMRTSEIRELLSIAVRADIISFAGGMPNNELFPVAELDEIYQTIPLQTKQEGFQYGPTGGWPPLLESLSRFLAAKGLPLVGNRLMITTGSLQAINLVAKIFIDPGDIVITETPCFIGAISAFKSYQADLVAVQMDQDGIVIAELRQALDKHHQQGQLVYLTPNFHNPAGLIYSRERRLQVLDTLAGRDLILLEDDAYSDLYFLEQDRKLTRAIKSLADESMPICYCGSFSKIFGPGMRLGWLLGPEEIIRQCEIAKQSMDACTSTFTQMLAHEFLSRGKLEEYLQRIRPIYDRRCQLLLDSMQKYMPAGVSWNRPIGGFYVWAKLPRGMDATEIAKRALSRGAIVVVGKTFDPQGMANDHIRLAFCHTPEERMAEGVKIIAEAIRSAL